MDALYDCLEDDYSDTKEYALILIKDIVEFDPEFFSKDLENFIQIIVEHYHDEGAVSKIEDEVLEALANTQNAISLLLILSPMILKEEPPVLQALIKTIKHVISSSSEYELSPILKKVADPLITTFNHPHANVRKSVVFCLVELYFVIGDSFESCLEELNPSQQKLV